MSIKLNSIQEALKFRGKFVDGDYIDRDGVNHGPCGGCYDPCIFKGDSGEREKWGCYLLAEQGLSKEAIFKAQLAMSNSESCGYFTPYDNNIEDLEVRSDINRIAKKNGHYD